MKKLLLVGIVAAFAVAAQAGDKACGDKDSAGCSAKAKVSTSTATPEMGCCATAKVQTSTEAKDDCCSAKAATSTGTCPFKAKVATKSTRNRQALVSPKARSLAG
jgi:hypothetical protein